MRKIVTLALVLVAGVALTACSDGEVDKAAQDAQRTKMLEEEFKPLQAKYMALFDKERSAANKIIPIKNQIRGAKKSDNANLAAELQTKLEAAEQTWQALKDELTNMENERTTMMNKLRRLGHKFRGDK